MTLRKRALDGLTIALLAIAGMMLLGTVAGRLRGDDKSLSPPPSTPLKQNDRLTRWMAEWNKVEIDPARFYRLSQGGDRIGPEDADVTIVVFSDYACEHCAAFAPTLEHLRARFPDHVAVIYRHFIPMLARSNLRVHLAAECAYDQGRFSEYTHAAFAHPDVMARRNGWRSLATIADVPDMATFVACTRSEHDIGRIRDDNKTAVSLGVTGTPTSFVNGYRVVGEAPFPLLDSLVAYQLDRLQPEVGH